MMRFARAWGASLAAGVLASCAGAAGDRGGGGMAVSIADDAAAFNEAYAQAVSGQLLLNILRGRDRLPRYYLAMTGINDSPSLRQRVTGSIGSVSLGEGGSPWGIGGLSGERETQRRPSYSVQPFNAETLTRTAFQPIAPYVFAHYWRSGWPRDILLLLLVERIDVEGASGAASAFNEANTIASDCTDGGGSGCAFVHMARGLLAESETMEAPLSVTEGEAVCGLIAAYQPARPVRAAAAAAGEACMPRIIAGDRRYTLHLRSLDDAVYYLGELLRASWTQDPRGVAEAPVTVRAAGLRGGGAGVPLFRVVPEGAAGEGAYAASIVYGGRRYFAGPAIARSCAEASATGACRDDAASGDRSSSVLSLLAELMALNQSPEAIRAPSRLIAD